MDAAPLPQRCKESITAPAFTVHPDGLTLNVMDSADTDDTTAPSDLVALFNKQFDELGPANETGHGWILTHRPSGGAIPKLSASRGRDRKLHARSEVWRRCFPVSTQSIVR